MKLDDNKVLNHMGDVLGEFIRGEWHTKDANVLEFIKEQEQGEKVRARDKKGHYVKDDPSTPENEAWTTKKSKGKK